MLFPEQLKAPVSTSSESLTMLQPEVCLRSSLSPIHDAVKAAPFTMTFTTATFDRSSSWLFEASSYKAAPRGLPSSLVQHALCAPS